MQDSNADPHALSRANSPHPSVYIPPGGPPQGITPHPDIFATMGEERIFKMVEDLYRELEQSSIRNLFPEDMITASQRSAAFFVYILGGPPLYQRQYGSPMMRKRHLPFRIDERARQEWLQCFKNILIDADVKYSFPLVHMNSFLHFLDQFSLWMVNTK